MATVPQRRVAPWGHHQSLEVGKGHWLDFSMGSVTLNSFKCQWQMDIASLKTEIVSLCVELFFESFIEMFFLY